MKKEHQRRDWIMQQQQQLLEAKYRKHMAKENPISKLVEGGDEEIAPYLPEAGFAVYVDYILNLPTRVQNQVCGISLA